ncbi:MAG: YtxH domain-containing protein [Chloroflexota bacterium]|nr:YtxH domain-containing protein [Chloroflexota bacterium]
MRNRTLLTAAVAAAATYLLDPQLGEDRRQRALDFWHDNRGARGDVGRAASQVGRTARPLMKRVSHMHVEPALGGKEVGVRRVLIGVALGGVIAYFLDPKRGSERRQQVVEAWTQRRDQATRAGRSAMSQASDLVKPQVQEISKHVTASAEDVKETLKK